MLFGDASSFAIEYDLDREFGGEWLFGKMCYWIGGSRIGNYDLGTSLRDVLFQIKYIGHCCGDRFGEGLCKIGPEEIFYLIDGALYGEGGEGSSALIKIPDDLARYDVRVPVDVFDEWKIYLVDCEQGAMLMYKHEDEKKPSFYSLPKYRFDKIFLDFYGRLESDYEKETFLDK